MGDKGLFLYRERLELKKKGTLAVDRSGNICCIRRKHTTELCIISLDYLLSILLYPSSLWSHHFQKHHIIFKNVGESVEKWTIPAIFFFIMFQFSFKRISCNTFTNIHHSDFLLTPVRDDWFFSLNLQSKSATSNPTALSVSLNKINGIAIYFLLLAIMWSHWKTLRNNDDDMQFISSIIFQSETSEEKWSLSPLIISIKFFATFYISVIFTLQGY